MTSENHEHANEAPAEKMHQPLPVKGYTAQSNHATDAADATKKLEEQCLRHFETLAADVRLDCDPRCLSTAKTELQTAFMWAVRSIFKPKRIDL